LSVLETARQAGEARRFCRRRTTVAGMIGFRSEIAKGAIPRHGEKQQE